MELKPAIITIDRVALRTVRLIEAIIVQERLARHQIVLRSAGTWSKQVKKRATMAKKLDSAIIVR